MNEPACISKNIHIADIDFPAFYRPAFPDTEQAQAFVTQVESIPKDGTKVVLHQAARMIWLGDRMEEVAQGRAPLQILFFLIAAETVAKMGL